MSWTSALVLLGFCAHALAAAVKEKPCTLPESAKATINGTKNTYFHKETISYTCNTGFRQNDNKSTLECQKNGNWKPTGPKCRQIKCKKFKLDNGKVVFGNLTFNTNGTITCFSGYQLRGPSVVTCGANDSWSQDPPTCERVTCPLPAVPNSSGLGGRQEYEVGEQITISCQEGFELIGSSQVTCEADGQWQGLPQCRLTGGKCLPPPLITNAHIEQVIQRYYEPSKVPVRFKCNHGYRMVRGPSTTYCSNGQWTDIEMVCDRKKCGSAGEIENGRYHYTGSLFGDTVTASCDEGFQLVGLNIRHCRANGWDGRAPVCEAIECPEPPQVPYADLDFETNGAIKSGHVASYSCRNGRLIGMADIICTEDGTWSAPPPRCEVATCRPPRVRSGLIVSGESSQYVSGNSVRFMCSSGRLLGPDVITCGTHGSWTPRLPFCTNCWLWLRTGPQRYRFHLGYAIHKHSSSVFPFSSHFAKKQN